MAENKKPVGYKDETKTSFVNFLSEFANYFFVIATAVLTMSLSIFMDLINSTCNLLRTGICTFLSIKLQKNQSFKYNYGTENLETISMLICDSLLTVGSGAVMVFAVVRLFNPTEPAKGLLAGVIYKLWCVIVDLCLLFASWRVFKRTGTKVAKTNYEGTLGGTSFDFAIFVSVLCAYIFRGYQFVVYIEPVASILIAIVIIFKSIKRIKVYFNELTYTTLNEEDQIKITTVLVRHFDEFENLFSVNSHKSGQCVYIDFLISFSQETTYSEIVSVLLVITEELEQIFEECKVSIMFDNQTAKKLN